MQDSMTSKVKAIWANWPAAEMTGFRMLLESLALDSSDIDKLAKPVEDCIREEARQKYGKACAAVMLGLVLILVCAWANTNGLQPHDDAGLRAVWIVSALLCIVLLLCMWGLYKYFDVSDLISDKKLLLYQRFVQEGALGDMLEELQGKAGVIIHGEQAEEERSYRLLKPWAAKAAVLIFVLMNLLLGGMTLRGMTAFYQPGADGLTLISASSWTGAEGTIVIPSEKAGQPVTAIGKLAFENRQNVKKIVVPDTVKVIESGAFRGCVNLEEIVLPDTLEVLGAEAFSGCRSLKSFTLPSKVTELRADTFLNCIALTNVKLHDGVTTIRASAFSGCYSLKQIELPKLLKELPARLFYQCESLKSIVIPASVTEIGAYSFEGCKQLTEVVFESDMSGGKISEAAFRWCTSLKKFNVPKGVTKISSEAFYGCSALEEITMPDWLAECKISASTFQNCTSLRSIVIPEGVTDISAHAFRGCTKLSSVTMPKSLKRIGSSAFRECKSLTSILLPLGCEKESNSFKDSPTQIGYMARGTVYTKSENGAVLVSWDSNATGVVEVAAEYQGAPVVGIEEEAFRELEGITKVILPDTIKIIGEKAFYHCINLQEIDLPSALKTVGEYAFYGCKQLKSVTFPEGVKSLGEYSFSSCPLLAEVTIPRDCSKYRAFDYMVDVNYFAAAGDAKTSTPTNYSGTSAQMFAAMAKATATPKPTAAPTATPPLTYAADGMVYQVRTDTVALIAWNGDINADGVVTVPAKLDGLPVTEIGKNVFSGRTEITKVILPDTVTYIGDSAFKGCSQLAEIDLPSQLQVIGVKAFEGCAMLESVTLPKGLREIQMYAFSNCTNLKSVSVPSSLESIGWNVFSGCTSMTTLTLPSSCSVPQNAFIFSPHIQVEYK